MTGVQTCALPIYAAAERQADVGEGRARFMALSGLILSGMVLYNMVLNFIVLFIVPACG